MKLQILFRIHYKDKSIEEKVFNRCEVLNNEHIVDEFFNTLHKNCIEKIDGYIKYVDNLNKIGCSYYEPIEEYARKDELVEIIYEDGKKIREYVFKELQMGVPVYVYGKEDIGYGSKFLEINNISSIVGMKKFRHEVVLENSHKNGNLVTDSYRLYGNKLDHKCEKCGANLIYYSTYDTEFCPECNEWRSPKCGSHYCDYCRLRPERPLS